MVTQQVSQPGAAADQCGLDSADAAGVGAAPEGNPPASSPLHPVDAKPATATTKGSRFALSLFLGSEIAGSANALYQTLLASLGRSCKRPE